MGKGDLKVARLKAGRDIVEFGAVSRFDRPIFASFIIILVCSNLAVSACQMATARLLGLFSLCLIPVVPNQLLFEEAFSDKDKVKNHQEGPNHVAQKGPGCLFNIHDPIDAAEIE